MDSDDEMDLTAIRAKNMAQLNNMFGDIFTESEKIVEEVKGDLGEFLGPQRTIVRQKRKRDDELFRFTGIIPLERRKSERLTNTKPKYSFSDLEKVEGYENFDTDNDRDPDFYVDLEEIIREPNAKRRKIMHRATISVEIRMPEEISESELSKIAKKSGNKTYSQTGTSCHQCRQKTIDTKTICRSRRCIGVRGQFCGPCLKNRYGEDARECLLDPDWSCPPCRGLCNCSICRTRDGKRPTGILAPTVQQEGYTSVKDFLLNLAEKGIFKEKNQMKKSPEKRRIDDVIATEQTDSVINALLKSYVTKMLEKQSKYHEPKTNDLPQLYGFVGGHPVHQSTSEDQTGDLLGFTKDKMHYCMLNDDFVYLCLLM